MKQKLDKWDGWLQSVYEDMRHQAASQTVYRETMALIAANPHVPMDSDFLDFMDQWYVDSTVMGLRRQLKVNANSVSLAGLLEDIATNATLLSRERFVSLYPRELRGHAHGVFDKHAGEGAAHVDADTVRTEVGKLKDLAARCEEYADRLVAHRDRRGITASPTHEELDQAIAFARQLLQKYFLLLRADSLASVTPVFLQNWKRIFEVPWGRSLSG